MSLLDDLKAIDFSSIAAARVDLRASIDSPGFAAIISGGAEQAALGSLGASISQLLDSLDDPEALFGPVTDALTELAGSLDIGDIPIARYIETVLDAIERVAGLIKGAETDPLKFAGALGLPLGDFAKKAKDIGAKFTGDALPDIAQFRELIDNVQSVSTADPAALGRLVVTAILPFPSTGLFEASASLRTILDNAEKIRLPENMTLELVAAIDGVATAAASGQAPAVQAALLRVQTARAQTVARVHASLDAMTSQIDSLRLDQALGVIANVGATIQRGTTGIIEFLEQLRADIVQSRGFIQNIDAGVSLARLDEIFVIFEQQAKLLIADPIDRQIEDIKAWLRALLRESPVRKVREEISAVILGVAAKMREVDPAGKIEGVRAEMRRVGQTLAGAGLVDDIRESIQRVKQEISDAITRMLEPLNRIADGVRAAAGQAQGVLARAADALDAFAKVAADVQAQIDAMSIEDAAGSIVSTLADLRKTAEELLSVAPLPDALRPVIEEFTEAVRSIDLEVVFAPVKDSVGRLTIPDEIGAGIRVGIIAVQGVIDNLIPAELIASIEADISGAIDTVGKFDPSTLTSSIRKFLDDAAKKVESVDPSSLVGKLSGAHGKLSQGVDFIDPHRLLAPVIEAYQSAIAAIPTPDPSASARRTAEAVSAVAEPLSRATAEPLRQLMPANAVSETTPPGQLPATSLPVEDLRPGDIVRFLGFIPAKLRETLAGLEAGPVGEVLKTIDDATGALVRRLREVQGVIYEIESRFAGSLDASLAPLGAAQLRAQLAIRANFTAGGAIDIQAATSAIALAGPFSMRASLAPRSGTIRTHIRAAASSGVGKHSGAFERLASALASCRLTSITTDLDAFLKALDPEPIALELDLLVKDALAKVPEIAVQAEEALRKLAARLKQLLDTFNPGAQMQKFLSILMIIKEELEVIDPAKLAAELAQVHIVLKQTVAALDPALFGADIKATLATLAASLRTLDPGALLGDLSFLTEPVRQLEALRPSRFLEGVGTELKEIGERLGELDPGAILASVEQVGPLVVRDLENAAKAIKEEVVALLEAIRFATSGASVSASASVEVG